MTLAFQKLELELIQTQIAQKPMLRAEVHAYAMRASQPETNAIFKQKLPRKWSREIARERATPL